MSKRGGACCSLAERMPGARRLPFPAHQPVRDLLARHGPSSGTSPSFFPSPPLFPPSTDVPDLVPPSLACLSIDDTLSILVPHLWNARLSLPRAKRGNVSDFCNFYATPARFPLESRSEVIS